MNIEIVPFPHSFYLSLTSMISYDLLTTHSGMAALQRLTHPWQEHEVAPTGSEVKPAGEAVGGGSSGNPIRQLAADIALHDPDDQRRIPSQDGSGGDWLINRVRGRWRHPPAWQRGDFERVMKQPLEETLQQLKAHTWPTYAALAKTYRKPGDWISRSLKWCTVRERLATPDEFDTFFPVSQQKKKQKQQQHTKGMNRR